MDDKLQAAIDRNDIEVERRRVAELFLREFIMAIFATDEIQAAIAAIGAERVAEGMLREFTVAALSLGEMTPKLKERILLSVEVKETVRDMREEHKEVEKNIIADTMSRHGVKRSRLYEALAMDEALGMKEMPPKKSAKERHQETRRHLFQIGVSAADQEHIETGVRLAFEQIEPHVKELLRLKELLRPVN